MPDQHADGPPQPKPIPIPADFPVTWAQEEDAQLGLELDRMHFPAPIPLLEVQIWGSAIDKGITQAHEAFGIPLLMTSRHINHYFYNCMMPSAPLEEMGERMQLAEARIDDAEKRLEALWTEEWLPEIKEHLAFWDAFDLGRADLSQLADHFEETLRKSDRLWTVHFLIVTPVYGALNSFDELYKDLFEEEEDAFQALRLLQGLDNKSLETDRALWSLSRTANDSKDVCETIQALPADQIKEALNATTDGQSFLAEMDTFLSTYGERGPTWSIHLPSWIEDPTPAFMILKDYVSQPNRDPMAELNAQAEARDQAVSVVRERLKGYPQTVIDEFETRLSTAQLANVLTEDHGFWLDFKGNHRIRMVCVEAGSRLAAAGIIPTADDVFELSTDEVIQALRGHETSNLDDAVSERRADRAHFATIDAPARLGMDYGPPPPGTMTQVFVKFFGIPPEPDEDPAVLNGRAGSPGKVRGTARVVHSLSDADRLEKGEILVTGATSPPWTPLFSVAGAIVTDTGGILSHCAVVAREYSIPAVVGVGRATTGIKDGQLIEVDGDAGVVRIVS